MKFRLEFPKLKTDCFLTNRSKILLQNPDQLIRKRAALAFGRIGDERAVDALIKLLENDSDISVRATAAFSLGEIESIKASDAILKVLQNTELADEIRARSVEAAGKIAAANAKAEKSKDLSIAISEVLQFENSRGKLQNRDVILLGITAILRAKPNDGDLTAAFFLTNSDGRIRADAANTLSRLRSKNSNEELRKMLVSDTDAIARANAARALGAAEDKAAYNALLGAAIADRDARVRVSAIRSLGNLKDAKASEVLLKQAEKLLLSFKNSKFANPIETNEILEISAVLGKLLEKTENARAIKFLTEFDFLDKYKSPEISTAIYRIKPRTKLSEEKKKALKSDWKALSSTVQAISEIQNLEKNTDNDDFKAEIISELDKMVKNALLPENSGDLAKALMSPGISDLMRTYAAFKTENTDKYLREFLLSRDVFIRATAAGLLGERSSTVENLEALKNAFTKSLSTDKIYNDALLAILSALVKLDKSQAVSTLKTALNAPDYLVRKQAADLISQNDLSQELPDAAQKVGSVNLYDAKTGTKLGQVLNNEADYLRAVSRKTAKAVITTEKGIFTIEFYPESAPLTVDNFIKLANSKYFDGVAIHRVVSNFVVQDGDPRGDGNGGPGWSIRDEINMIPYERGTVGMALSGKNTGGSQWFVTHSPQPHLDGGYTVFGKVNENDMKIVDNLVRGDKILSVKITDGNQLQEVIRRKRKR